MSHNMSLYVVTTNSATEPATPDFICHMCGVISLIEIHHTRYPTTCVGFITTLLLVNQSLEYAHRSPCYPIISNLLP